MSNVRLKIIAAVSPEELEQHTNEFLAQENVEAKQMEPPIPVRIYIRSS